MLADQGGKADQAQQHGAAELRRRARCGRPPWPRARSAASAATKRPPGVQRRSVPRRQRSARRSAAADRRDTGRARPGRRSSRHGPSAGAAGRRAARASSSGSASSSWRQSRSTSDSGACEQGLERLAPARRGRDRPDPGPAGRVTKPSERPGPTWGSARSAARTAAFCPAASPSKQRIGAAESRQSRPSWPSVSAVPSGATASPMPAWSSAITSIWPSTTITLFASRLAGAGLVEVEQGAALVEQGRVGRIEIFGLARAQDPAAEGDHPAARIADREHQPAAEAVIGLALVLLRGDQQAGLDQLVVAELLERRLELAPRIGREAEAELGERRGGECRAPSR